MNIKGIKDFENIEGYSEYMSKLCSDIIANNDYLLSRFDECFSQNEKLVKYVDYLGVELEKHTNDISEYVECVNGFRFSYEDFKKDKKTCILDSKISSLIK